MPWGGLWASNSLFEGTFSPAVVRCPRFRVLFGGEPPTIRAGLKICGEEKGGKGRKREEKRGIECQSFYHSSVFRPEATEGGISCSVVSCPLFVGVLPVFRLARGFLGSWFTFYT